MAVGSLSDDGASWAGAKDMAGNVWEWTADNYGEYLSEAQTNPTEKISFRIADRMVEFPSANCASINLLILLLRPHYLSLMSGYQPFAFQPSPQLIGVRFADMQLAGFLSSSFNS